LVILGLALSGRSVSRLWARRRKRQADLHAIEAGRQQAEALVRRHFPYLSDSEYAVLTSAVDLAAEASPIELVRVDGATQSLVRKGFLIPDVVTDDARSLFCLTQAAATLAPPLLAARQRAAIVEGLEKVDEHGRTLLQLFAVPDPPPSEPSHAMLANDVYRAVDPLVHAGVLKRAKPLSPYIRTPIHEPTETILLVPEATPFLEDLVLKAKVVRTSVQLDLSRIYSSMAVGVVSDIVRPPLPH
jgi:hypothetical protein